jgi:hypothetical protein|tara:strand:+ start:1315 stop:1545 length:231 start_codon:yes stop_codon:yes gene_type:complete
LIQSDNDIKHDICIEVLNEYLNAFKISERAMRILPSSLTRKERTELTYYQEMVRNIKMVRDYVDTRTESVNWEWDS